MQNLRRLNGLGHHIWRFLENRCVARAATISLQVHGEMRTLQNAVTNAELHSERQNGDWPVRLVAGGPHERLTPDHTVGILTFLSHEMPQRESLEML